MWVQGAQVFDDGFAFRRVIPQGGKQRAFGHFFAADARRCDHCRTTTVTKSDGAGLVQQQHVHVPRRFHRATGFGDHVEAHQAVHAGDADGRQQAANGCRNQRHQQCDQEHQRQAAIGEMGERLQGHHHQQEDQGEADQQDIQRDFVGGFLALGAFHQGDHPIEGGLTGVGGDANQQPVRHQPCVAGDGRTVAAGFANDRCGFAGDRRFVDRRDAFDDFAVTGDHFPGSDAHHIPLAQAGGRHHFEAAIGLFTPRTQAFTASLEAVGAGLATPFGQGFGEVGEQHGEPQPHGDLHGDEGGHGGVGHKAQHGGEDGGQFDHQHYRRALQLARVQLDEGLHQRRTPQSGDGGFSGLLRGYGSGIFCRHIHVHIPL